DFDHTTADDAQARWQALGLPEPTTFIASGHGVHAYWRLSEPLTDLGVWSCFQRDLAAAVGSDPAVSDPPRIMRLPGFRNHKPPAADCRIIAAILASVCDLADLAESIPQAAETPAAESTHPGVPPTTGRTHGDGENVSGGNLAALARAARYAATWPGGAQGGRNSEAMKHAAQLVRDFALSDDEARPILVAWNARNEPPLDDGELHRCLANGRKYGRHAVGAKLDTRRQVAPIEQEPLNPTAEVFQPFPIEALPEPVRSFVAKAARAIGCDPSYIALPMLSGLASAIGNTRCIQLKRCWTEPAIIWTAIVGESGTLKTPAFKLAVRSIHQLQIRKLREHQAAHEQFEKGHLRYEADLSAWKKEAAKGKGTAGAPPEKPEPPQAERYIVSDITVEALAPILLANQRGVLLARDELAGWVGSFDRYVSGKGGADASHWESMHNGESIVVDRKTGQPRTIYVPSASASVTGGIQPGILDRVMGVEHRESGLLARLLLAFPPRGAKRWTEAEIAPELETAISAIFDRLYDLRAGEDDNGDPRPQTVKLTPEGKRAWGRVR
ncbi:MAG: DUF3987 domain-containing protein, partial [Planctomycetota bacterium]